MSAYYNEHDPYAAQWLRNLIAAGHIAPGDVDERGIIDVRADDIRGYTQAHFFAGIGGWSVALRLAGWPDDRPVWSGSCPCQPFSTAGQGKAGDDERHLWPAWASLIRECRPGTVFGEQVEAAIGWGWLDLVFADLGAEGYACGAAVLPACGVGAPHIRQRLWFVADADERRGGRNAGAIPGEEGQTRGSVRRIADGAEPGGAPRGVADADGRDAGAERLQRGGEQQQQSQNRGAGGGLGDAESLRLLRRQDDLNQGRRERSPGQGSAFGGFWSDAIWLPCTDGKARPAQSRFQPLAHGVLKRPSKLRAYGNAIVPQVAAEFVQAFLEAAP